MSGFSRVSISGSLRTTIQDIKEIAGQHSDEDVYAMLKECNMDPNETAQKLLYLDTFHEVKKKRDRRKVDVRNRAYEEYGRRPGMQRRGSRHGRESYHPSYHSDDVGGRRQLYARQQNGYANPAGRASRASNPVLHKRVPAVVSSAARRNGMICLPNGSSNHEVGSQLAEHNVGGSIKDIKADENNKTGELPSLPAVSLKQLQTSDPGPSPTPTPVTAEARVEGGSSKSKSSNIGNIVGSPSVSGLYASASDPVLVPSLNPRNPGAVGIIKRETGNHWNAADISANPLADTRVNAVQNGTIGQAVSRTVDVTSNSQQFDYQGVERSPVVEPSRLPSSSTHHNAAATVDQETCTAQKTSGATKDSSLQSLLTQEDASSTQATSEVDINLQKLHISQRKSVIFPNHLHVPEAFKNALTFGSLDAPLGQNTEDSNSSDVSGLTNVEAAKEPSLAHQSTSSISGNQDYPDQPPSSPREPVNLAESHENISSGTAMRYDQSKQEILQPIGGSHNPFLPPMPDYGLSLVPPVVGSQLVQLEGLESQGGNSMIPSTTGSIPSMAQPTGIAQNSIAVSPQLFPYLRQPYPPNYIPYSPYYSQLYMPPQNAHHLLSPSAFAQQPSAGNVYMPPTAAAAAAASGVKFPIPQMYKQGNLSGNLTHLISSGYGSYGAAGLGYGSSMPLAPGTSATNDDIAGSELKEKNIYSMMKQNEELHLLASASGREIPTLPTNIFYNLPQAQPLAFSPAQVGHNSFPGIYHPTQNMSAASLVQSLQQSQAVGGTVDSSMVPPLTSYPPQLQLQTHQQHIPIPQPQHGQMNWNQQLMSRENI